MNRDRGETWLIFAVLVVLALYVAMLFSGNIVSTRNTLHRLREAYPEYDFRAGRGVRVQVYVNGTWLYLDEWRR